MPCHRDRRMTKPVARRPLRPTGVDGMGPASTSSWRLASSPMALVTRPYRLPPRAARRLRGRTDRREEVENRGQIFSILRRIVVLFNEKPGKYGPIPAAFAVDCFCRAGS
jgi:hypothetical protein